MDRTRLDAMLGRSCMLFVVEDQSTARVDLVALGFGTTDVYAVAERLGALPEDLPCLVFFACGPRTSPDADVTGHRLRRAEATGKTVLAVLTGATDLYRKTRGLG